MQYLLGAWFRTSRTKESPPPPPVGVHIHRTNTAIDRTRAPPQYLYSPSVVHHTQLSFRGPGSTLAHLMVLSYANGTIKCAVCAPFRKLDGSQSTTMPSTPNRPVVLLLWYSPLSLALFHSLPDAALTFVLQTSAVFKPLAFLWDAPDTADTASECCAVDVQFAFTTAETGNCSIVIEHLGIVSEVWCFAQALPCPLFSSFGIGVPPHNINHSLIQSTAFPWYHVCSVSVCLSGPYTSLLQVCRLAKTCIREAGFGLVVLPLIIRVTHRVLGRGSWVQCMSSVRIQAACGISSIIFRLLEKEGPACRISTDVAHICSPSAPDMAPNLLERGAENRSVPMFCGRDQKWDNITDACYANFFRPAEVAEWASGSPPAPAGKAMFTISAGVSFPVCAHHNCVCDGNGCAKHI